MSEKKLKGPQKDAVKKMVDFRKSKQEKPTADLIISMNFDRSFWRILHSEMESSLIPI